MVGVFDYSEYIFWEHDTLDSVHTDVFHLEAFGGRLTTWGGPIVKVFRRSLQLLNSSYGVQYRYTMYYIRMVDFVPCFQSDIHNIQ